MSKKVSLKIWSNYYLFYILMLIFFGIFILYSKHNVGNDSSLSDWLINYSGGFVRRGLTGQVVIEFSNTFSFALRDSILIFQIFFFTIYYLLIYFFFREITINRLILLAIFSPIFIFYPVAETEALGRKEILIFFILILYLLSNLLNFKIQLLFKLIIFPISILIWEPVIIFFPYLFLVDLITFKINKLNKNFYFLILSFFPIFFTTLLIYLNPFSVENFNKMVSVLINDFGEKCYMSCNYVGNQSENSFMELLIAHTEIIELQHLIRYTLIILIGFFPLFSLLKVSNLRNSNILLFSKFDNLLIPFFFAFLPSSLLYMTMYDWGRIVHISYTFMLLSYVYFLKNKLIEINFEKLKNNFLSKMSKKKFIFLFIIFCFCWNPKTVMRADIATNSLYKIVYNSSKKIFGFEGVRLFQDSPIIKFHEKFFE